MDPFQTDNEPLSKNNAAAVYRYQQQRSEEKPDTY